VATEFFLDPNRKAAAAAVPPPPPPVFLSDALLEFGFVAARGSGERRSVVVTNTTGAKITVQWLVPPELAELQLHGPGVSGPAAKGSPRARPAERRLDEDDAPRPGTWDVQPRTFDLGPGQELAVTVTCRPAHANAYFCRELEAVACFKTQRTFRLVDDATLQPPWCLKVRGVAHSVVGEQFAAQVALSAYRGVVEFPGTHVGDATYQTVRVDNHSNLPAQFVFEPPPPPPGVGGVGGGVGGGGGRRAVFEVKPRAGLVPPGSFALVLCRFAPPAAGRFRHALVCDVNHSGVAQARALTLQGTGSWPEVRVAECDRLRRALGLPPDAPSPPLYLKATCAGLASTRTLTLHNPHRIPAVFAVEVPARLRAVFAVTPRSGLLRGNQTAQLTVAFAPRHHREYKLKVVVQARATGGAPPPHLFGDARMIGDAAAAAAYVSETAVTVLAPGSGAVLAFEPPHLDFGNLLVNNTADATFTLVRIALAQCHFLVGVFLFFL
jgi:hypothetical protein